MEVVNSADAASKVKNLLAAFRKNNRLIIHIQHVSNRKGATFFLPGTIGIETHESILPLADETVLFKNFPNSFRETGLEKVLQKKGVKKITFCGMMSHMCIDATVRAAFDKGFRCVVADDACATRDLTHNGVDVSSAHFHASFMAALGAVYADVMTSAEVINKLGQGDNL